MVKLYHLSVLYKSSTKSTALCSASDLSSFGFFQRNSCQEFMNFTSQILSERTHIGTRASVKQQSYMCHVYVRADGLCGVLISDHEYPPRVGHTLLNKVLEDFTTKVPASRWDGQDLSSISMPNLQEYLDKYQDPKQADAMSRIQADLDETKIIIHNTLEAVLQRGEKIEDLVDKSEQLNMHSKMFYRTAKKTNSCCVIL